MRKDTIFTEKHFFLRKTRFCVKTRFLRKTCFLRKNTFVRQTCFLQKKTRFLRSWIVIHSHANSTCLRETHSLHYIRRVMVAYGLKLPLKIVDMT